MISEPHETNHYEPPRWDSNAKYSTGDLAVRCKITRRQAQRVCRSVLGERLRYRMTQEEFDRVRFWYATWGYKKLCEGLSKKTSPLNV